MITILFCEITCNNLYFVGYVNVFSRKDLLKRTCNIFIHPHNGFGQEPEHNKPLEMPKGTEGL